MKPLQPLQPLNAQRPDLRILSGTPAVAVPTVRTVDPITGDGTWQGPAKMLIMNERHAGASLDDANAALNHTARIFAEKYPDIYSRLLKEDQKFLKVAEKISRLENAHADLDLKRELPDLDALQLQLFIGASVMLRGEGFSGNFSDALKIYFEQFTEKMGWNRLVNTSDPHYADVADQVVLAAVQSALALHDGNVESLLPKVWHDRSILLLQNEIANAVDLAQTYLERARLLKKNPAGWWIETGEMFSLEGIAELFKGPEAEAKLSPLVEKFSELIKTVKETPSHESAALDVLEPEESQLIRKFHAALSQGGWEERIRGYACYAYHRPEFEVSCEGGIFKVEYTIDAEDARILGGTLKHPDGTTEPVLALRISRPIPPDEIFARADNRIVILRPDQAPAIRHLADLGDATLHAAVNAFIEDLKLNPRWADSRGEFLTIRDLFDRFIDPDAFKRPGFKMPPGYVPESVFIGDPAELKGYRHLPAIELESEEDFARFRYLFFIEEGLVMELEIADKSTGSVTPHVIIRDAKASRYLVLTPGQKPQKIAFGAVVTGKTEGLLEAFEVMRQRLGLAD